MSQVTVVCKRCGQAEASAELLFPGEVEATALCSECEAAVVRGVRSEVVARLKSQPPFPGEDVLYQPVELDECSSWRVIREDSRRRADLMRSVIEEITVVGDSQPVSYLDLGCTTGYFCHEMSRLGLETRGVDRVKEDIEIARLLEAFLRRDRTSYAVTDIHEYLRDTRQQRIDITSAFSVIPWLIIQESLKVGMEALAWLFEKTQRVCFLEMDYASEDPYSEEFRKLMDRSLVQRLMEKSGMFGDVRCYEASEHGLMGDLFVGFKSDHTGLAGNDPGESFRRLQSFADEIELVQIVSPLLERLLKRFPKGEYFRLLEEKGIHLLPVDHYQPVPDTRALGDPLWEPKKDLPGVDLNTKVQLELLTQSFPRFREEYDAIPRDESPEPERFSLANQMFSGTDALAYYCMIRNFSPARIIEIGSGPFTLVAIEAAKRADPSPVISVGQDTRDSIALTTGVTVERIDQLEASVFERLEKNDILFIDSSHVSRIGGDVNFLFLEVFPRLAPGVLVQLRDIFLPMEYPRDWVLDEKRFWNEQYLLQAFLIFNSDWEVLLANNYLAWHFSEEMKKTFPNSPWWGGGSFWMRRRLE